MPFSADREDVKSFLMENDGNEQVWLLEVLVLSNKILGDNNFPRSGSGSGMTGSSRPSVCAVPRKDAKEMRRSSSSDRAR
mmetsp:Transcript_53221/g.64167  ORF Transcript_53221/g.64167 Transcript_53221/m.64167 type:complete len:80 (+) Transcript_53221:1052-1291(+)